MHEWWAQPGRNTLSYVHHHRLSVSITRVTRVCRNNLIHFSGAMLTNPAFNPPRSMRPFDFPYREPRHSACPPSPPSLFRFPGIRVIEFIAERMENMEEGFENVSRWGWNILPPFSSFLFVLYKRHVNFGLCIRIKQEYHFLFYKYTIQFKIRIFLYNETYTLVFIFYFSFVLSSLSKYIFVNFP